MHVHSYYSGPATTPFVRRFCRESYNDPEEVYAVLERKGMSLFTLTDHDSIDGAEKLRSRPGFFLSEELTCRMPSGTEVHIGVYDFHERQHEELQRRRNDLVRLLMYLTERRIFFSVNHVFSSLTGRREREDFDWFCKYFPAVETRNSHMPPESNASAATLAKQWRKIGVGGSDAHAMPSVGTAYTEVPGARDKEEFFAGLQAGLGRVHGECGGFYKLTRDCLAIALELMREKAWTIALSPLALLIPAVTLYSCVDDHLFGRRWAAVVLDTDSASLHWQSLGARSALQTPGIAMGESV
ncbi:MAG TPA: PHP domain-containing protein [Candidatus Acidoferrum sp.]|nr:PHP domain-containing protein [Candidatus Acidoferrum sp.]